MGDIGQQQAAPAWQAEAISGFARSELFDRVRHLDARMYAEAAAVEPPHPVLAQLERLKDAFEA